MQTGFTGNMTIGGTALANIATVQVPFGTVKTVDFVAVNQSDNIMRRIPTVIDPGEITFTSLYDKTDYLALVAVKGAVASYVVTTPTGSNLQTFSLQGILTKCDVEMSAENLMEVKGTVAVAGPITIS